MLLPVMSNTRLSDPHHPMLKNSNFAAESKINAELHESSNTGETRNESDGKLVFGITLHMWLAAVRLSQ